MKKVFFNNDEEWHHYKHGCKKISVAFSETIIFKLHYKTSTVSVGFLFAKIKAENMLIQIRWRKNRTKNETDKAQFWVDHFYKF